MEKSVLTINGPIAIVLEPGQYFWCACGKSKNQPFCDGSHQGTDVLPTSFKIDVKKQVYLCQCKNSKNKPYCDGTHNKF